MTSVLIANRGEIACRIIRTCREMNLETIAVYSEADARARHVLEADQAHLLGPAPVRESYLNFDAVLAAAQASSAMLVHPGYGLLAENAGFAEAVEASGLRWVGPRADTISVMGDKARARAFAVDADVPVVPGSPLLDVNDDLGVLGVAERIGYPVLVKASGGGGGIGMCRADGPDTLVKTVRSVSDLALRHFGDGGVFIERYVRRARHVEVQVFGLGDGRVFDLGDRDCSIQRRYQKIIEEGPAPRLSCATRAAMAAAACRLASHQRYAGAGTVEFILDADSDEFFFLEMNTRIQVEHPVTEMITDTDIVALQLQLALGKNLSSYCHTARDAAGHALECRLYAERPERKFLPSPGTLKRLRFPKVSSDLRIDTGFVEGDVITPHYDPLVAKIIVRGRNRVEALNRMELALKRVEITGLSTNLDFLRRALSHQDFRGASMDTSFVDRHLEGLIRG